MMKTAKFVLLITLFLSFKTESWSQQPPTVSQPEQPKPTEQKANAKQDQSGSEEVPLFVKIVPTERTEADIQQARQEASNSANNERDLTWWTMALVFATLSLAAVAAVQACLFVWQLWIMRAGMHDARVVADAAKTSADAATLSAKAAVRLELPILRALEIELSDLDEPRPEIGDYVGVDVVLIPGPYSTVGILRFVNIGRTPAIFAELKIGWESRDALPEVPNYRIIKGMFGALKKGKTMEIESPSHTIELSQDQIEALIERGISLWFFAAVSFSDFMDDLHEVRFCWKWGCPDGVGDHYFVREHDCPAEYTRST